MPDLPLAREFQRWAHTFPNRLTQAVAARRAAGGEMLDLIGAGAYENGLGFPDDRLQTIAADAVRRSAMYRPDARGQPETRTAIVEYYARRAVHVDAQNVVLTPGTSVAYLYILRLLLNAGEEVLVPYPGYPLFDDLCLFAGIRLRYYHMRIENGRWRIDLDDLDFQCTSTTRAVMAVSPHNPLGTVLSREDLDGLAMLCRGRGLALVFDEVFSEFVPRAAWPISRPQGAPLYIILNGLSKMLSLPGLKIGWMAVGGDRDLVVPFLEALEYTSDLFLPVSEISQAMAGPLLAMTDLMSRRFAEELMARRHIVEAILAEHARPSDGGVYICVSLPTSMDEDEFVLQALEAGVLVHPGHFYNLPQHVVMTCLARPETLSEGARRLCHMLR